MKCLYITIEIILSGALMYCGERVGTKNIWFVLVAIIVSHFVMNILYNIRSFEEGNRPKTRTVTKSNRTETTHNKPKTCEPTTIEFDINNIERSFYNQDTN